MGRYQVTYPLAGEVTVVVEADSEAEAINLGWDLTTDDEAQMSWSTLEHIVDGNVFCSEFTNDIIVEPAD